jgi:hypothetical protein
MYLSLKITPHSSSCSWKEMGGREKQRITIELRVSLHLSHVYSLTANESGTKIHWPNSVPADYDCHEKGERERKHLFRISFQSSSLHPQIVQVNFVRRSFHLAIYHLVSLSPFVIVIRCQTSLKREE